MTDVGTRATDKALERLESKLKRTYRTARKELQLKLEAYAKQFAKVDAEMRLKLDKDQITPAQYRNWKKVAVFRGDQWRALIKQSTQILSDTNGAALRMVNNDRLGVFATNANYQSYQICKDTGMDLAFAVYDEDSVRLLLKDNPDLLPSKYLDKRKDGAWITGQINTAVTQSIIQGESIPATALRIAKQTGETNEKAMIRFARTAMTSAQNAGRMESLHRATDMGISVKKVWLATLDRRTRDSHRHLDGQTKDIDEPFISDFGKIMFPGDPEAEPGDTFNCRCTLTYEYEGYPSQNAERREEGGGLIEDTTYDEWVKGKDFYRPPKESKKAEKVVPYRGTTLQMYDEALEWAMDAQSAKMEELRIGWGNVPEQIEAFDEFEKDIPAFERDLRDAIEKNDFATRTSGVSIEKILQDGRMKSQIETGASRGYLDMDRRKVASSQLFAGSEPLQLKDSEYEIYGYLGNAPRAKMYGDCRIVFDKDKLIDRTTITVGDSLELLETGADPMPTMAREPKMVSYGDIFSESIPNAKSQLQTLRRDFESIREKGYMGDGNYIELQFHGGVSLEDIAYIEVPKSLANAHEIETIAIEKGVKIKWLR